MLKIDTDWLLEALESHELGVEHFLDTQTGDIIRTNDMLGVMDEQEEFYEQRDLDPDRWVFIDPVPSRDGFCIMEAFVDDLPEGENKRTLDKALSWKKPFSNFREALRGMPEVREAWFAFHRERMLEHARAWLKDVGIETELT